MMGILIIGTKYRTKKIQPPSGYADVPAQYCPFCKSYQEPAFLRTDKYFTFFFIPLCRLKKDHQIHVKCSNCSANMVLPPKGALSTYTKQVRQPSNQGSSFKDGQGSSAGGSGTHAGALVCPACGQPWKMENMFCPNDGTPKPKFPVHSS